MEDSGIVGFTVTGAMEKVTDFRTAPFCSQAIFAQMLGLEDITEDVVWTTPAPVDISQPHNEALSKASGLTPPR
ncbi:hypothetical protein HMPREF2886_18760 [Pseudomonas sp. HMSC066A08]|nr:hypothetical protein HMPREF2886_18760 [Pseudomonas sp. HMSC066A08]